MNVLCVWAEEARGLDFAGVDLHVRMLLLFQQDQSGGHLEELVEVDMAFASHQTVNNDLILLIHGSVPNLVGVNESVAGLKVVEGFLDLEYFRRRESPVDVPLHREVGVMGMVVGLDAVSHNNIIANR